MHAEIKRSLGSIKNSANGPTLIFIGGLHGNEPAGVVALQKVVAWLEINPGIIRGNFHALAGNVQALRQNVRFLEKDLNRIWTDEHARQIETGAFQLDSLKDEWKEMTELYLELKGILENNPPPYFFIDLHSVSSQSCPFIVINDMLINRELASKFPLPIILGVEEHVYGSLLNRVNKMGYVAIGFEAGQNDDPMSVQRHEAFIWLILYHTGCLAESYPFDPDAWQPHLHCSFEHVFFELKHRQSIQPGEQFYMLPGFVNFQKVSRGQPLAQNEKGPILAPSNGYIFLPLYQSKGSDGFFIIREVSRFALALSVFLRRINFERVLTLLPGVRRDPEKHYRLIVNINIARFLATDFFHLLGYRRVQQRDNFLYFTRREFDKRAKGKK